MTTNEFDDGLGFEDEETPSERLGRELAEADLQLIAQIRAKRIERGLKQAELAKLLGISQATVSEFESGMTEPRMQTVRRYARALGIMIEHRVRDAEMSYSSSGISVETRVRPGVQYTLGRALGPYTAAANSKPTDFALVA